MSDEVEVKYKVLSNTSNVASVEFQNPYFDKKVKEEDRDESNSHVTKTVNIPLDEKGEVDEAAFKQRLEEQARGVLNRIEQARANKSTKVKEDSLKGFSHTNKVD